MRWFSECGSAQGGAEKGGEKALGAGEASQKVWLNLLLATEAETSSRTTQHVDSRNWVGTQALAFPSRSFWSLQPRGFPETTWL